MGKAFKDLRAFLRKIEASDKLVRVKKEVDPNQEISAAIIKAGAAALFCEKVKGYDIPVVANLFADRAKIELALALQTKNLIEEYSKRLEKLKPPKRVRSGPVKENIITGNNDTPIHLDPSSACKRKTGLLTSKLGMDATLPLGVPYPEVCDVSKEVMKKIEDNRQEYLNG